MMHRTMVLRIASLSLPLLLLAASPELLSAGCSEGASTGPSKSLPRICWDLSTDRTPEKFSWFDFDAARGAIDESHHLKLKFDDSRTFTGRTELITFSRHTFPEKMLVVSINLPSMTADEVTKTLRTLARDWSLSTERGLRHTDADAKPGDGGQDPP